MPTVLVLDDDPSVLGLLGTYLRRSGFAVLQSSSVESAQEQIRCAPGKVDLLIADVNLPIRSGVTVAANLHTDYHDLKFIFVSGYPLEDWSRGDREILHQLPPNLVRILPKPFSPMDLVNKVDELIGRTQSGEIGSSGG